MYLTKSAAMLAAISAAQSTPRVDWCVRSISTTGGTGPNELFYIVPCNGPDYGEGALYVPAYIYCPLRPLISQRLLGPRWRLSFTGLIGSPCA